ncbi:MAG: hypothetical protein M1819_002788 [Sarea resinae]|nr:MAG: hypothetical protein M1819_002788 [Sarea resinae]
MDRFDALVFIGDSMVRNIYLAFNILLRENVALGGLKQWEMSEAERAACRCENQFIKMECSKFSVREDKEVLLHGSASGYTGQYSCDSEFIKKLSDKDHKSAGSLLQSGTPHVYLPISGSPASEAQHSSFTDLLNQTPGSYKPIPIVHSLSQAASFSWTSATASMGEWVALADAADRNTPFLWLGPVAAGVLKPPSQILTQGNNALHHFTAEMVREAKARGIEALGMFNLTVQATSWDGTNYGERVALVQAMMVINWLSRLETS